MQLYVDRNRPKTEALLKKINGLGLKGIFVTVDAAAPGKREADERSRAEVEVVSTPSFSLLPHRMCPGDVPQGYVEIDTADRRLRVFLEGKSLQTNKEEESVVRSEDSLTRNCLGTI